MPATGSQQPIQRAATELSHTLLPSDVLIETIPDAIALYDQDGKMVQTNRTFRQLLGLTDDVPLLQSTLDERFAQFTVTDVDGLPLTLEEWPLARLLRGEVVDGAEARDIYLRAFDGNHVWLSPCGTTLRGPDGVITGALLMLRNVTARRQAAADLAKAEAGRRQLEAIMRVLPAGVAIYDEQGRLIDQNPAAERITGRSVGKRERPTTRQARYGMRDMQGAPLTEPQSPSGRARRGETFTDLETIMTDPTGRDRFLLTSGAPIRDAEEGFRGAVVVFQDVTQLYKFQREARDQRKLSEAIIATTPFGLAVFDPTDDFRCLRHNRPFLQLVGTEWQARGDIVNVPLADLLDAESASRTRAIFEQVRSSGEAFFLPEYRAVLPPNPDPRWYKWSLTPLYDSVGTMTGLMVAAVEITEQVRAREAQAHEAARLQAVLDVLPTGVAIVDAQGHTTDFNQGFLQLWGLDATDAHDFANHDRGRYQMWWPDGRPIAPEERPMTVALRSGTPAPDQELEIQAFDGQRRIVLNSSAPILDPTTGAVIGGAAALRDITALKRLEQRTQASLNALLRMTQQAVIAGEDLPTIAHGIAQVAREVMGCLRVGVVAIDPTTYHQHGLAVVGLTASEETHWWEEQKTAGRFGDGANPELLRQFLSGEPLVMDMTKPPYDTAPNEYGITQALFIPLILDDKILGMLSLDYAGENHRFTEQEIALARGVADLAALVMERERLQAANAAAQARAYALEATNTRMNTFLGIASHELRTPITSIKTSVQLADRALQRFYAAGAPESTLPHLGRMVELLGIADGQVDKLNRFIADLLDVTHIQSGTIEITPTTMDLAAVVRDVVATQHLHWPQRSIRVALPTTPAPVWGNVDRLGQVVTNLLTNALKYAPPPAPIHVRLTTENGRARVEVSDHGPGLTLAQQAELFQAFGRVEGIEPQNGSSVGLGLGLFICKTIVEMLGGQMGVISQPGAGATFWFELPLL